MKAEEKKTLICDTCGKEFEGAVITIGRFVSRRHECPACEQKREAEEEEIRREELTYAIVARKKKWRDNSGIPPYLLQKTFANFEKYQRTAFKQVKEWAEGFDIDNPREYPSLILCSDSPGVGKTHLMVAIVNAIIDKWVGDPENSPIKPIRFESGPGLVRRIRSTFNLPLDSTHEREEDVYNELKGVRLLLIDDVGKEKPSSSTREVYWFIIDERMKSGLPVVISSRIPLEPGEGTLEELMGGDTVDRLYGMSRGKIIKFKGNSYRREANSV